MDDLFASPKVTREQWRKSPERLRRLTQNGEEMMQRNDNGTTTGNAAPRTIIGETAVIAELQATIARLTAELEAAQTQSALFDVELKRLREAIKMKGGTEHSPTEDAYNAACAAIRKHKGRAEAAEALLPRAYEAGREDAAGDVSYAEIDAARLVVDKPDIPQCGWLNDPLFVAKIVKHIISSRRALHTPSPASSASVTMITLTP